MAGYDLLNEPSETFPRRMGDQVVSLYDRLYQAIRAIDPDHIIIMEAIWWWDTLPNPQQKNWENVVYSLHYYQWQNNEDFTVMKNAVDGWIQDAQKWVQIQRTASGSSRCSEMPNPGITGFSNLQKPAATDNLVL